MFEIIGIFTVTVVTLFLLTLQYSMLEFKKYEDYPNKIDYIIELIPLLPFILMFLITIYYLLGFLLKRINKWFELNWGWLFINGRKRDEWSKHLRNKYGEE
jgi:hypothetical protein